MMISSHSSRASLHQREPLAKVSSRGRPFLPQPAEPHDSRPAGLYDRCIPARRHRNKLLPTGVLKADPGGRCPSSGRKSMQRNIIRLATGVFAIALIAGSAAVWAQSAPPIRIRGTIEKVDGNTLVIKAREGNEVTVTTPDNVRVMGFEIGRASGRGRGKIPRT